MRDRSELWQKLAARGDFDLDAAAVIDGRAYTAISAPKIETALCDSALSVGNCISSSLEFSVLTDDVIPPSSDVVIWARLRNRDKATEWKEFGTFFIDRREDNDGLVTLQCFDAMLKAGQQYTDPDDPEDSMGWPKSMNDCVKEIARCIGVEVDPRTVIKTGESYLLDYPEKLTMQQVLGYIGACHGGNWVITPENRLRLVPLVSPSPKSFDILDYEYSRLFTEKGDKLVWMHTETGGTVEHPAGGGLVRVPVVTGSITTGTAFTVTRTTIAADEDMSYTKGNGPGGEIRIDDNPYACQAICDDLYAAYNGLEYAPYTAAGACFDPCAELGDWIVMGDKVRSVLYKQTLTFGNCFRADCEAPYQEEVSGEYPYQSAIQRLKQADKDTKKYAESQASNVLAQTSESINAEVIRATGSEEALHAKVDITASDIRSELSVSLAASEASITEGYTAAVEQLAQNMVSAADLIDGQTEISGDNIKTGNLSADRVSGGTLVLGDTGNEKGRLQINKDSGEAFCILDNAGLTFSGDSSGIDGSPSLAVTPGSPGDEACTSFIVSRPLVFCPGSNSGVAFRYGGSDGAGSYPATFYFGGAVSMASLTVSGSKSREAGTENYGHRLLYCYETPSPMFGDTGEGRTDSTGVCIISFDDIFFETVNTHMLAFY